MQIDVDLLKQFRDTADWFIQLPQKLIEAVMGSRQVYYERKERIRKAKELAELQEIGKSLQSLYLMKGSLSDWMSEIQIDGRMTSLSSVRELFVEISEKISEISKVIEETSISNLSLGSECAVQLARSQHVFRQLGDLPDDALIADAGMVDVMSRLQEVTEAGTRLLLKVDEHRRSLDSMY
ncbi:hypothetical protein QFZ27_000177 [Inquilinus ginsengisoli]|uniref:hypothetical protein n=1 Tax=Inquilinus ginsengisoli TaxID=363840 RepID=UPI003D225566